MLVLSALPLGPAPPGLSDLGLGGGGAAVALVGRDADEGAAQAARRTAARAPMASISASSARAAYSHRGTA